MKEILPIVLGMSGISIEQEAERIVRHIKNRKPHQLRGTVVSVRTEPKIGRNEPCPCGSEKKFKNCCNK